jgi:hypothetical protein
MKIVISYTSAWENSFLDGDIESHFNKTRTYVGSIQAGFDTYKKVTTTKETVIGIVNRLIGEQRRLFQARQDPKYYFRDMESNITFQETQTSVSDEVAFLRNLNESYDQGVLCGVKRDEVNPIFSEQYKDRLWGILEYTAEELLAFLCNGTEFTKTFHTCDRVAICEMLDKQVGKNLYRGDKIKLTPEQQSQALDAIISKHRLLEKSDFVREGEVIEDSDIAKKVNFGTMVFCSLNLMIQKLKDEPDFKRGLSAKGNLSGLSRRSVTPKDFMGACGDKKRIIGNPTCYKGFEVQEDGTKKKVTRYLKKKNGKITIMLDIDKDKAKELKEMIENAGVNCFVVGKKGLAFVENIFE